MTRILSDDEGDITETIVIALGILTIFPYLLLTFFIALIYVPKLNFVLENLYDSAVANFIL